MVNHTMPPVLFVICVREPDDGRAILSGLPARGLIGRIFISLFMVIYIFVGVESHPAKTGES
jgi:hypothetical protein